MQYNSDDSADESPKHPFISLQNSPEDNFSTPQRKDITLTPSNLSFKMTEPDKKSSLKTSSDQSVRPKYSASSSATNFETSFSDKRVAEIEAEKLKASAEFPNPIEETLKGFSFASIEENEQWYDIPSEVSSDQSQEQRNKDMIRANILKAQRRQFYSTVTRMKNRIMRDNSVSTPAEWKEIQAKARATLQSLTSITDELKTYGFQNTQQEMTSFAKYFSDLKTMMHKIDNIVDTEGDGELHDAFLNTYLKEEDAFSKGISVDDLTNDFNAFNQASGASANSTRVKFDTNVDAVGDDGLNVDDLLFGNTRKQQPADSDDKEETICANPSASKSFYSEPQFNSQQGTYTPNVTFPPNANNPPPNQRGPGGQPPGGQPPNPPGGQQPNYNWGMPPPNPPQPQQQQNWAGYPQQGYQPYPYQFPAKPNYQGIKKIQVEKFDGSEETYKRFKLTFASAYVKNRNLPDSDLALILVDSLKGEPLALIQKYLNNCTTDLSYKKIWKLLEERYGGQNVEDAHVIVAFKFAAPLKNSSMKELERILDIISVQYEYYKRYDPASLQAERSLLFQTAKEKLSPEFSMKFVRHTTKNNFVPNFISLKRFLKAEFLVAQTTERE